MIFVLIIFLAILGLFFYTTGLGCYSLLTHFFTFSKKIFWYSFSLAQVFFIVLMFIPSRITHIINSYWQAFMFYFFMFSILGILLKLLPIDIKWKKIIDISVITLTLVVVAIGLFIANNIQITKYEIKINKEINDMNIVVFSDTHLGYSIGYERIAKVVKETNKLKPDIVLIPGDIFDGSIGNVKDLDKIAKELKKIKSTYGVYAVLGNHDYMKDEKKIKQFLKGSNITILQDEYVVVNGINIIGRHDASPIGGTGYTRKSIEELISEVDNTLPIIMMDHQPTDIDNATKSKVDLLVAGHSHNGQVYPGSIVTNLIFKVGYGYKTFNDSHVVVTSGVGYWGPPIRIGTVSEVVSIKLSSK